MSEKKLVHKALGLELNERLAKIVTGRMEYGYKDDLMLCFCVKAASGASIAVTEEEFAASKSQAEIGVFCTIDPTKAIEILVRTYPNADIVMRKSRKSCT